MQRSIKRRAVYTMVQRGGEEKGLWIRIGVGFVLPDGSVSVSLDALPVDGKLTIRDWTPARGGEK
jgi:hypothetical protein